MFRIIFTLCFILSLSTAAFAQEKVYIVAHDATWPPMEFIDENRNIVGYSVDYIDAVAKEAGINIKHESVAWEGIFAALGKKFDIISSSVTITDDRKKVIDFTLPYFQVAQALIVPKDINVNELTDLKGQKIGSQIGTTGFIAVKDTPGVISQSYDEIGMAMAALAAGRVMGVVCDDPIAKNYILTNKDYASTMKIALILPITIPEEYGFAVAKGNDELRELLNKGIEAVKEKGIEAELRKKWVE